MQERAPAGATEADGIHRYLAQTPYKCKISHVNEKYLEDLQVGDRFGSDTIEVTEESIYDFARQFDPQPFHLDREAATNSIFKELTASGWHTAAMTMRLYVTGKFQPAGGSIGLAVDELRWPQPVRPGDVLKLETEILDVRSSKSKPDRGIIRIRNVTTNQRGEVVQTFMAFVMVRRRPGNLE
ncbi:MAG TPA: MaoC family dehydratase [Chthoniobacterales bacterium]|nr:MaoC family dehydratase [Chthoniobacterales bacterium]